ncbi:MAG: hypothetical protein Q8Q81_06805 [Oxalobacteraceae bacterium]|nr:hypothetical protein [Oxalobacteraceae bacterium]
MRKIFQMNPFCWLPPLLLAYIMCVSIGQAAAAGPDTNPAVSLRAKYAELGPQLSDNQFKRPLHLDSAESPTQLKGDIYALVDYPFAAVKQALSEPTHWCELLILHLNIKYCRASAGTAGSMLAVSIGTKHHQPLAQAFGVEFAFNPAATTPEYFDLRLNAKKGPLGTSDYRIRLEAATVQSGKTFLHLTYSYSYNFAGRAAMQAYLATIGSDKVGFTITGKQTAGQPDHIGGVRGVVERNTMRYYLAIDAYLGGLSTPPAQQLEKRLESWFASTEHYPRQLHEVDRAAYLDMKRREYLRQQQSR